MPRRLHPEEERDFWTHVDRVSDPAGCWPWAGPRNHEGYGYISQDGKHFGAHRISYMLAGNDAPFGYDIDHLCGNRSCVNPAHLQAVTHQENIRRGNTGYATAGISKRPPRRHGIEITDHEPEWYSYPKDAGRIDKRCRICVRQAMKEMRARRKAAR